ncbi:MAG: TonB C-terminal domain-containing protein, partial [Kiritimatiellia bacterium]|nr:TonB C-terminal domain-containing protein [Kiritimatiellia bacterium]
PPVQTNRPPTKAEIERMLAQNLPSRPVSSQPEEIPSWYFGLVKQAFYDIWAQPSGLSASSGLRVDATVRVCRDGSILRRTVTRRSGNSVMDASVQQALDAVNRLRPLPDTFRGAHRDITIAFELTGP